jgi:hypothetical protein
MVHLEIRKQTLFWSVGFMQSSDIFGFSRMSAHTWRESFFSWNVLQDKIAFKVSRC